MNYEERRQQKAIKEARECEQDFHVLLDEIIARIDAIDKELPFTSVIEPKWWLDMMDVYRVAIEKKTAERG